MASSDLWDPVGIILASVIAIAWFINDSLLQEAFLNLSPKQQQQQQQQQQEQEELLGDIDLRWRCR